MRRLRVKQPGPRTTIEDLGRRGVARFGVPPGGAFDPLALRAANRLVGNPDDAAGVEMTLLGPTLEHVGDEPIAAALVGTPVAPVRSRRGEKESLPCHRAFVLEPGDVLRLSVPLRSARAWLALEGGCDVPLVLGSRGTYVPAAFGGLEGRPLRAGDVLEVGTGVGPVADEVWNDPLSETEAATVLALLPGPQIESFAADVLERLCDLTWQAEVSSDRTGVRLAPVAGEPAPALAAPRGIAPEGTTLGAIQVPPDGTPILLGPDRPITGGYAKPALVARAHVGRLARLRPGEAVRFARMTMTEALELERARRESLPEETRG